MKRWPLLFEVAAFEWRLMMRNPAFWFIHALHVLVAGGLLYVSGTQATGAISRLDAPFMIIMFTIFVTIHLTFFLSELMGQAVLRDDQTGFGPILRGTPLTPWSYLVGRGLGQLGAFAAILTAIPLGLTLASWLPNLDPALFGALQPWSHLWALVVMSLPLGFLFVAIVFAIASLTRSMTWVNNGIVIFGFGVLIGVCALAARHQDLPAALLDPSGLIALRLANLYMTPSELDTRFPTLSGLFIANRVLWLLVAAAVFTLAVVLFRFEPGERRRSPGKEASPADPGASVPEAPPERLPDPRVDRQTLWAQAFRVMRFETMTLLKDPSFVSFLVLTPLLTEVLLWSVNEQYGVASRPVTRLMVQNLNGTAGWFINFMVVVYGFEVFRRDRAQRMHEIVDATSAPSWLMLLPKLAALSVVAVSVGLAMLVGAISVQLMRGVFELEPLTYLSGFFLPKLVGGIQVACMTVFVLQLLLNEGVGLGLAVFLMALPAYLAWMGVDHGLFRFAAAPDVPLSDMNGQGRFWVARSWFQLYWTLFACQLAVWALAFWRRGEVGPLRVRLAEARRRLAGGPARVWLASGAAFLAVGGVIAWNTCVLNPYLSAGAVEKQQAEAEKTLRRFEDLPQPRIVGVTLKVDLYPRETRAVTDGVYHVENRTGKAISELHVDLNPRLRLERLAFPGARLRTEYREWGHRIYDLTPPLEPGERRDLRFRTVLEERGFVHSAPLTSLVENGTFLDNSDLSPFIGVRHDAFLIDRAKRRKYGLPVVRHAPSPGEARGRDRSLLRPDSDWVTTDLTLTTDSDQTPVAPGYVVSDSTARGRRTVHVRSDVPVQHFFSFQSARYAVARDRVGDIELAVYHHPGHATHVKRMLRAMKLSLRLYSKAFSPYPFRQARIVEFPAYRPFAQSFANTVPYSEDVGFLADVSDPQKIDVVTYVTAHEMAHQWWGHQVTASDQQGGRFLIESLSQYSALLVMEKFYGPEAMRRFLKFELDEYLKGRTTEGTEEVPLSRVENQPYIHYQKGSLALWWLKEVIGAPAINRALASFVKEYAFRPAPYPSSRDLLRHLRREAGPRHEALISDLFETITLLDLRARDPRVTKRPDGRWDVAFTVAARKFRADGRGVETEVPLDEDVDVGVFASEVGSPGYTASDVLVMRRARLHTGTQSVQVTVDREPAYVGVDPYNKRIDRNSDDNLVGVAGTSW